MYQTVEEEQYTIRPLLVIINTDFSYHYYHSILSSSNSAAK